MVHTPPVINIIAKAMEKAGKSLRRDLGEIQRLQVSRKGPGDFVSNADHRAQAILVEELKKYRPSFGFQLEEGESIMGEDEHTWYVDPLDGTTNFLHGIPTFASSVALVRQNEVVVGAIYEPVYGHFYWAAKGEGAYFGEQRMRVANREILEESVVATLPPFVGREDPDFLRHFNTINQRIAGVRCLGCPSLTLAWVAAGQLDGVWLRGLEPWDIAAGCLMIREAGGRVSNFKNQPYSIVDREIVGANLKLHPVLFQLLQESASTS